MPADVSAPVLTRWLGISEVAVRDLARRGIVVKTGRGRYALEESVRRVCAHYCDIASDKGGAASLADIRAQRIRLTRATAEREELRIARERGELVPAAEVARSAHASRARRAHY